MTPSGPPALSKMNTLTPVLSVLASPGAPPLNSVPTHRKDLVKCRLEALLRQPITRRVTPLQQVVHLAVDAGRLARAHQQTCLGHAVQLVRHLTFTAHACAVGLLLLVVVVLLAAVAAAVALVLRLLFFSWWCCFL
eukprot:23692-Chlamydomonas_euryale.AAC.12